MLGIIVFGLKILFAAIMGGALNYIPDKIEDSYKIIESALICIFSAAVLGLTSYFTENGQAFTMGFGVLSVSVIIMSITKNSDLNNRMILLFSSVIGMIIGSGYLIQAFLLGLLAYVIIHNSEHLLDYIHKNSEEVNDSRVKNISK